MKKLIISVSMAALFTMSVLVFGFSFFLFIHKVNAVTLTPSGPIVISGQSGTVISGLRITSTSTDCVQIINSTNITITNSDIGPCGTNKTLNNSRGVYVSGSTGVNIYDNYIHVENLASGCCDTHDGVFATGNSSNIIIQGNVLAYNESNIEFINVSNASVIGNFLLNPQGPFPRGENVQSWGSGASFNQNVVVQQNYALASTDTSKYLMSENQSDSLNFGFSNGIVVSGNYIQGGHSSSGCGVIADNAANNAQFLSNILTNTGNCGIGIADGVGHVIDSNKVLNLNPVIGGGNVAVYVWKQSTSNPLGCGGTTTPYQITLSNNIADEWDGVIQPYHNGFWNGGGCDPLNLVNNIFGQTAYAELYPMATTNPPPLIPPLPKNCTVVSPYTTQTSMPLCNGATSSDTTSPSVSITSPASGATVSGTVTVAASASDNVAVAGVQFKLDGANLGSEVTASPYSASWNTATATNAMHTLTAVARDPAGNTATSTESVTVNNPVSDTIPPSTPTNLTATAVSSSQINLSWIASTDNIGVTGYKIYRNGSQIATVATTSYSDTGLTAATTYTYTVAAYDAAGNTSAQSSSVSATTQSASTQKFQINDRVQTTAALNVRSKPKIGGGSKLLGTQPLGALGTVIGGPQTGSGYTWWNINYDNPPDGWSVQNYLQKVTIASAFAPAPVGNAPAMTQEKRSQRIVDLERQLAALQAQVASLLNALGR